MMLLNHLVSSSLSLWRGTQVRPGIEKPAQLLQLYDIEGSPACRLVREALTELDLDVTIYPCPKGGVRFRSRAMTLGGEERFPYLVDPNTGRSLYRAGDIVSYLFEQYSNERMPLKWRNMTFNKVSSALATLPRFGAGSYARPSKKPDLLLELYSFESSPYARPVREWLCEFELPYVLRNLGKGHWEDYLLPDLRKTFRKNYLPTTSNRLKLLEGTGRVASPYLFDPNTGTALYESSAIIDYLIRRYGV